MFWRLPVLLTLLISVYGKKECNKRFYDQESFVCVCKYDSCDEVEPLGTLGLNAVLYSSTKETDRLSRSEIKPTVNGNPKIVVDSSRKFQKIIGFGGAITDASMIVLRRATDEKLKVADLLLPQYYGEKGISYSLGRVPIGSCDFSDREYSYLDRDQDFELESFSLSDFEYNKTNFLRNVISATERKIKFFASPWSSPGWMKSTGKMRGGGTLRGSFNGVYYLTYAKYFLRFFEEYAKEGIEFWGVTVQNEPSSGADPFYDWQTLFLSPEMQRDFVQHRLGPMLKNHWLTKDIKIMAHDDQRNGILTAAQYIYAKDKEHSYIDGLGVHWYSQSSYEPLNETHNLQPDKFILSTEACNAYAPSDHIPLLGSWKYAENYAHDIMNNLLNHVAGWTDWNIWLDLHGGPNWVGNFVDAPIIVNVSGAEFYKQPMYYILGHFSKFVVPDSVRVDVKIDGFEGKETDPLQAAAFLTPDSNYVVVIFNKDPNKAYKFSVSAAAEKPSFEVAVEPQAIKTLIWKTAGKRKSEKAFLKNTTVNRQ